MSFGGGDASRIDRIAATLPTTRAYIQRRARVQVHWQSRRASGGLSVAAAISIARVALKLYISKSRRAEHGDILCVIVYFTNK